MNRKDTPTLLKTHRHKTMPNLSSMKIAILFFLIGGLMYFMWGLMTDYFIL